MVGRNFVKKCWNTDDEPHSKWRKDFSLAEVTFEVTGKVWDCSNKESSEDEGDGIHAYLGMQFSTGEQLNPWDLQPFDQHTLVL